MVESEKPDIRIAFCPHCGNVVPQRLICKHAAAEWQGAPPDEFEEEARDDNYVYYVAVCETCGHVLLYCTGPWCDEEDIWHADLLWPKRHILPDVVPTSVRKCYDEASRIRQSAPNAFAAQIRRALEAICEDQQAGKGSLQKRLEELSFKNKIPPTLAEMTEVLRVLGNIGAHGIESEVSSYDASVIDRFFRAVVEYVYIAPEELRTFRESLKKFGRQQEASEVQDDDEHGPAALPFRPKNTIQ